MLISSQSDFGHSTSSFPGDLVEDGCPLRLFAHLGLDLRIEVPLRLEKSSQVFFTFLNQLGAEGTSLVEWHQPAKCSSTHACPRCPDVDRRPLDHLKCYVRSVRLGAVVRRGQLHACRQVVLVY